MFPFLSFLRLLGRFAVVLYFLAGVLVLGVRYWALPNVDQWRSAIERQLSQAFAMQVTLGEVRARWLGANPNLTLTDVSIRDPQRGEVLNLPQLRAVLSWRSIAGGNVQFVNLEASGLDLTVRRDAQGRIWALGHALQDTDTANPSPQDDIPPALAWLVAQRRIALNDVTLRWIDETRDAPPLVLHRARLQFQNQGEEHRFSLAVSPPANLAEILDVRGEFRFSGPGAPLALSRLQGRLYAHAGAFQADAWRPWIALPEGLGSVRASAQASLAFVDGRPSQLAVDASVRDARWALPGQDFVAMQAARLHLEGPWQVADSALAVLADQAEQAADAVLAAPAPAVGGAAWHAALFREGLSFRFQANGLQARVDGLSHPVALDRVSVQGGAALQPQDRLLLQLQDLTLVNPDMDLSLKGQWVSGGEAGVADVSGIFRRASVAAIARYLPDTVDPDAREWLSAGLLGGQVLDASVSLKGELAHFPFGDAPEKGDFLLDGAMSQVVIDYIPEPENGLYWPRLEGVDGRLRMHRVDLLLQASQASMRPAADAPPIVLNDVQARIPNIEREAELTVQGKSHAPAAAYLGLMRHTPLGDLLEDVFSEATGTGEWEVPLSLYVPLMHSLDTTVKGEVRFSGGSLRLMPELPPFEQLQGAVAFTERGVTARGLHGRFFGGAMTASGGIGPGTQGLRLAGRMQAEALAAHFDLAGLDRLQGATGYTVMLRRARDGGFSLQGESDLVGLALDFPPPYAKPAGAALPLKAAWAANADGGVNGGGMALDVRLGGDLHARLLHRQDRRAQSYFHAGAVGVRQALPAQSGGLRLDVQADALDLSAWETVVNDFALPRQGAETVPASNETASPPLLPPLQQLRVQARQGHMHGMEMESLTFTAARTSETQWRMDVSSTQTAGTLFWREADGKVEGSVQARFDRLAVGSPDSDADEKAEVALDAEQEKQLQDDLDFPAIDLQVEKFTLYGHRLGRLALVGVNQERGEQWRLDALHVKGDGAEVRGSGLWRLNGPQRGLTLKAEARITNLGAYLDQLGLKNVMASGHGSVQGDFFWRNLPWSLDMADVKGSIVIALEKGRFSQVNSRVARLLELLSLQSLQRLARLDFNLAGLVHDGFPYDVLRGELALDQGQLKTQDYRVVGPVGTIVIGGTVNIPAQDLNLRAVVVPNLDVSGAALAAGIAINPIVGVGAFLTQWLLRAPLAKAMTLEYRVRGKWDEPLVEEVKAAAGNAAPPAVQGTVPDAATPAR